MAPRCTRSFLFTECRRLYICRDGILFCDRANGVATKTRISKAVPSKTILIEMEAACIARMPIAQCTGPIATKPFTNELRSVAYEVEEAELLEEFVVEEAVPNTE